jgi:hypothetical protein
MKAILCMALFFIYPCFGHSFLLQVDASYNAVGTILSQVLTITLTL